MNKQFKLGEILLTNCNLNFNGFEIPKGTTFEIIEELYDSDFKVCFICKEQENPECIQVLTKEFITDIISSKRHFKFFYNDGVFAMEITFTDKDDTFIKSHLKSIIDNDFNKNPNSLYHIGFKNIKEIK